MLARVQSFVLSGIDDLACEVEVDIAEAGLPKTTVVGLPDAAVKESIERVRSAIENCGHVFPDARILVNLAPADLRKEGPIYDLPIAVGVLMANGLIRPAENGAAFDARQFLFAGELSLDGRLRPINGAVSLALNARKRKMRGVVLPIDNANEAAAVEGIEVYGVATLDAVVGMFNGSGPDVEPTPPMNISEMIRQSRAAVDFGEIKGQEAAKRAMIVAAAGGHNIVIDGPSASFGSCGVTGRVY